MTRAIQLELPRRTVDVFFVETPTQTLTIQFRLTMPFRCVKSHVAADGDIPYEEVRFVSLLKCFSKDGVTLSQCNIQPFDRLVLLTNETGLSGGARVDDPVMPDLPSGSEKVPRKPQRAKTTMMRLHFDLLCLGIIE